MENPCRLSSSIAKVWSVKNCMICKTHSPCIWWPCTTTIIGAVHSVPKRNAVFPFILFGLLCNTLKYQALSRAVVVNSNLFRGKVLVRGQRLIDKGKRCTKSKGWRTCTSYLTWPPFTTKILPPSEQGEATASFATRLLVLGTPEEVRNKKKKKKKKKRRQQLQNHLAIGRGKKWTGCKHQRKKVRVETKCWERWKTREIPSTWSLDSGIISETSGRSQTVSCVATL